MDWLKLMRSFSDKGLDSAKIRELTEMVKTDPSQAMKLAQELDFDSSLISELAKSVQQHPTIFASMAKTMGLKTEQVQQMMAKTMGLKTEQVQQMMDLAAKFSESKPQ